MSLANLPGQNTVPVNQPIVLQFNRFLNPSTVTRQNIQLQNASGGPLGDAVVDYDPVLLQVKLSNPAGNTNWLMVGQDYRINLPAAVPAMATGTGMGPATGGVQAIDNATLAQTTTLSFTVGPAGTAYSEPTMHFCADVWPLFKGPGFRTMFAPGVFSPIEHAGSCSSPNCHGAPQTYYVSGTSGPIFDLDAGDYRFPTGKSEPAQGLVLDTAAYVAQTAIGKVAHESNVGAMASASAAGPIFGINMPIIDPGTNGTGNPGNSWMVYKVLLAEPLPEALDDPSFSVVCSPFTTAASYQRGTSQVITPAERSLLSNFILGREMPYPSPVDGGPDVLVIPPPSQAGGAASGDALTLAEMERLRLWIKQGAQFDEFTLPDGGTTTECNSCKFPSSPDAGTMKDAASESGMTKDGAADTGATKDGAADAGTAG